MKFSNDIELIINKFDEIDNKNFININAYELTHENWRNIINFLNATHKITFKEYLTDFTSNEIKFELICDFWKKKTENGYMSIIHFEDFDINCYFNTLEILDFDAQYKDATDLEKLSQIIFFSQSLSKVLNKKVYLEEECYGYENKLVEIEENQINIP